MKRKSLSDWLRWMDQLGVHTVVLGLERVSEVQVRLNLQSPNFGIITVAGTNGKGSTVAFLEAAYRNAGYRTGSYFSPHLVRFNERILLAGHEASDALLVAAFAEVDAARAGVALTYFEFATLAALVLFRRAAVELAVLEVGLGGRLDAVNAFTPEISVVTSIGLDHMDYLGPDREAIGREKAGIFRNGRPAVCGDPAPPASVEREAVRVGARLYQLGRDFRFELQDGGWRWQAGPECHSGLPFPAMPGRHQLANASVARMTLSLLQDRWPVSAADFRRSLAVSIPGRFDVRLRPGKASIIFDVAHNGAAATALADALRQAPGGGRTIAVCGMLRDKPLQDVAAALRASIDVWHLVGVSGARGLEAAQLATAWAAAGIENVTCHDDVQMGFMAAESDARSEDRIVIFGSFHTVGAMMAQAPFSGG